MCLRVPAAPPRAGETSQQAICTKGAKRVKGVRHVRGLRSGQSATRREAGQQGGVGPSGAGAGASLHREGGGGKVTPAREPTPGGRQAQHSACACGGDLPRRVGLPGWREGMRHTLPRHLATPIPPAAPTARLDPFGSRRAPAAEKLLLAPAAK